MADIFHPDQAQRLFGSIMAGGSLGAISGPLLTANWVGQIGSGGVMTLSIFCLLVATALCHYSLAGLNDISIRINRPKSSVAASGKAQCMSSNQSTCLLICLLMLSHNLTATFLYNGLAVLVDENIVGFDERTQFFSYVDLIVQVLAFLFQFLITSRLVIYLGMPRTAILPPIILAAGFTILGQLARPRSVRCGPGGATRAELWLVGAGQGNAVHRC